MATGHVERGQKQVSYDGDADDVWMSFPGAACELEGEAGSFC